MMGTVSGRYTSTIEIMVKGGDTEEIQDNKGQQSEKIFWDNVDMMAAGGSEKRMGWQRNYGGFESEIIFHK